MPFVIPIEALSVARQAPKGKPEPIPLATAITSGSIFAHSYENNLPDRPNPHCTSSKNNKILFSRQI